jgi:GH15 family glucan-1,4-alpha-glucosidase
VPEGVRGSTSTPAPLETANAAATVEAVSAPADPDRRLLDHAVIGNGRVLALVSPTSAIEWLCLPRFDSPSIFARILDREHGGTFRFLGPEGELTGTMRYVRNSNVTHTVFESGTDRWEVIDFAPRIPDGLSVRVPLEIMRIVRPLSGAPRLSIDFSPRPDYARGTPTMTANPTGVTVSEPTISLRLESNVPSQHILDGTPFTLDTPAWFVLRDEGDAYDAPHSMESVQRHLDITVAGWRAWAKSIALPRFAPELVLRSALCLKLHASADSGAIIAAATTSIPEAMGTERTWDYRYCWLRDAAFVVEAFRVLGHLTEGEQFLNFLRDVVESGPLQPMYGIGGERDLDEIMLPHLAGFRGNGFVRVGNAAHTQAQHDLMGEMMLCLDTMLKDPRLVIDEPERFVPLVKRLVEEAILLGPRPDTSIWEFRTRTAHFTFSRAMCWAAVHRGAAIALRSGHDDLAAQWAAHAAAEREVVLSRGFNTRLGYFTQELDGIHPDAANLLLPSIGIVDARDPRFLSTLDAYAEHLQVDGLMQRYRNEDDFGPTTSAFTICSFWWVVALARAGRLDQAISVFERVARHANDVGLFSEDIDPVTGDLLGNFPQAYTHVGVIHAAMAIGRSLDARRGTGIAWE